MLRWAIPEFRLPQATVEKEIQRLEKMGAAFQCGVSIGKDKTIDDLKKDFQAIIIATGCPKHGTLNMEGEDLAGVYHGLPFLRDVRTGQAPAV